MKNEPLSPLFSITLLYLVLPSILFAVGWLRPVFAALNLVLVSLFCAALIGDLRQWFRHAGARSGAVSGLWAALSPRRGLWLPAAILLLWLMLSGAGGFGGQVKDYRASNALFLDLIVQDWPIRIVLDGIESRVVYYVAYYLPAAALGKVLGWRAANLGLFAWTAVGTSLSYLWFLRLSRLNLATTPTKLLGAVVVFCLAGGLDLFGDAYFRNAAESISSENEWWAGYFQYSSQTTLLFWVPQQTIAGWLAVGVAVHSVIDPRSWRYLALLMAALVLWSPFAALGILPFVAYATWVWLRSFRRPRTPAAGDLVLATGGLLLGLPHILYIVANRFSFPAGSLWPLVQDRVRLGTYYGVFCALEFGLLALLAVLLLWRAASEGSKAPGGSQAGEHSRLKHIADEFGISPVQIICFGVALAVLLVLPSFAAGIYNDLVMRASVPSLLVFWAFVAKIVVDSSPRIRLRYAALSIMILGTVVIGFYPAARGIVESVQNYHFGPPELAAVVSSPNANPREIVEQRLGDEGALFYRYLGR